MGKRLKAYKDNQKDAYKDLLKNPIWLNEGKKIPIQAACSALVDEEVVEGLSEDIQKKV